MCAPDGVDPAFYELLVRACDRYWGASHREDIDDGVLMHLEGVDGFTADGLREMSDEDIMTEIEAFSFERMIEANEAAS